MSHLLLSQSLHFTHESIPGSTFLSIMLLDIFTVSIILIHFLDFQDKLSQIFFWGKKDNSFVWQVPKGSGNIRRPNNNINKIFNYLFIHIILMNTKIFKKINIQNLIVDGLFSRIESG